MTDTIVSEEERNWPNEDITEQKTERLAFSSGD